VPGPDEQPAGLAPWTGFAVFVGYALIALIGGIFSFRTRDA
jgi:ABC-type transport system involved in multi-copper enzyme maturation permease subunit